MSARPSVTMGQRHFAQAPQRPHPRSVFNRSHGLKTAINAGILYPIELQEVLPGDTMNMRATVFARFATLTVPILDNVFMDVQWFFIPWRLVWDNFQAFMGEVEPGDTTEFTFPTLADGTTFAEETLGDYFGLPTGVALDGINSLPFRAYARVWNEWYRAEFLQDSVVQDRDDGPDDLADYALLPRGKRHDYFTSANPWPLRGGVEVPLPLGTVANIVADNPIEVVGDGNVVKFKHSGIGNSPQLQMAAGSSGVSWTPTPTGTGTAAVTWADTSLEITQTELDAAVVYADLSTATAATINDLRETIALQQLLEREARSGSRYVEQNLAAWGVRSSDQRLQRTEFLGGSTIPLQVNQVAATASVTTDLGDLGAYGTMVKANRGFVKTFEEHGYVLGLASVRADLNYQQGLDRLWTRSTKYDLPWPEFMNLGEQEIFSREIYCDGSANDLDIFGYQERYAEWRYSLSKVTGVMRSSHSTPLDFWHLAQEFGSRPTLGDTFIQENPPIARVIKAASEAQVLVDVFFNIKHARPLPTYSVPGLTRF